MLIYKLLRWMIEPHAQDTDPRSARRKDPRRASLRSTRAARSPERSPPPCRREAAKGGAPGFAKPPQVRPLAGALASTLSRQRR